MIHYAAQKGRTKISCRQRTVFRIRILLLENHSGYVASVLQLPAYLTTYHTPGRHGRVPAEYLDYLSTSLTFSPAALVLLFTVPVKGAWRLALLWVPIPPKSIGIIISHSILCVNHILGVMPDRGYRG